MKTAGQVCFEVLRGFLRERACLCKDGTRARTSAHDTGLGPLPIPHPHALPLSSGLQVASAAGCRGVPILFGGFPQRLSLWWAKMHFAACMGCTIFAYSDTLEVHHFAYCDTLEVLVFAGCDLGAGLVLQNVTPEAWVSTIKTRASTWMVAPTVLTHPKNLQKFAVGKSHECGAAGCRLDARRRRAQ